MDGIIHLLGLKDIKHSVIGNEEKRGISGGERKRVNIGMELVAGCHCRLLSRVDSILRAFYTILG